MASALQSLETSRAAVPAFPVLSAHKLSRFVLPPLPSY